MHSLHESMRPCSQALLPSVQRLRPCRAQWHEPAAVSPSAAQRLLSGRQAGPLSGASSLPLTCSFSLDTSSLSTSSSVLPSLAAITASRGLAAPKGFCRRRGGGAAGSGWARGGAGGPRACDRGWDPHGGPWQACRPLARHWQARDRPPPAGWVAPRAGSCAISIVLSFQGADRCPEPACRLQAARWRASGAHLGGLGILPLGFEAGSSGGVTGLQIEAGAASRRCGGSILRRHEEGGGRGRWGGRGCVHGVVVLRERCMHVRRSPVLSRAVWRDGGVPHRPRVAALFTQPSSG